MIRQDLKIYCPAILSGPFRVPDTLSVCDRLAILTHVSEQAARVDDLAVIANSFASNPAESILSYVQEKPFVKDPNGEWYQGVLYTLLFGGDCEDLSSLLLSMYLARGIKAELVWLEQQNRPLNHITVRVLKNGKMQWAEPSIKGAKVGENPYDALARTRDGKAM